MRCTPFTLLLIFFFLAACSGCTTIAPGAPANVQQPALPAGAADSPEEQVWALEYSFYSDIFNADYESAHSMVHPEFLGWPEGREHPMDYNESTLFVKGYVNRSAFCTAMVDRKGIRIQGNTALTQYVLNTTCTYPDGKRTARQHEITHTWVNESSGWQMLGGMGREV
jgi:hypothetical protein